MKKMLKHLKLIKKGRTREKNFKNRVWEKLLDSLEEYENKPRYIILDFGYQTKDNRDVSKIVLIKWAPDGCRIKEKMVFASTASAVQSAFDGIAKSYQANDFSDMDYDLVLEKCLNLISCQKQLF